MQPRQPRLGDILDDYCPREHRITNHAVVAMIGADVKQTRCTTCDAEHEYKKARVPTLRKKKDVAAVLAARVASPPAAAPTAHTDAPAVPSGRLLTSETAPGSEPQEAAATADTVPALASAPSGGEPAPQRVGQPGEGEEEGPVHRPLIRATLPRTENTMPTRQIPEFTIRQNGAGRPGKFRTGFAPRHRSVGGGALGQPGGGMRHGPRSVGHSGHAGHRSLSQQPRSAHAHGAHAARPGKKRSR